MNMKPAENNMKLEYLNNRWSKMMKMSKITKFVENVGNCQKFTKILTTTKMKNL